MQIKQIYHLHCLHKLQRHLQLQYSISNLKRVIHTHAGKRDALIHTSSRDKELHLLRLFPIWSSLIPQHKNLKTIRPGCLHFQWTRATLALSTSY
ncbi:hypothetical protein L1987_38970 [Smallanthus sonchifolius]|uniref:Uncharacterized protein n=1 Tax=Smallanthus sonchifolius TaxID=185202 RepID=A0ACB9HLL0_9ASTR|nr:hypothetical protein L1987_38970 [Smallanthus sonchifolius]